jgi:hypothetical protein
MSTPPVLGTPNPRTVQERIRERLARIKLEEKERERQRREGRKTGELTDSLVEKLRRCNPKQLKRVIKTARQYQRDHRCPPDLYDIRRTNSDVVASEKHRNKLFTLEWRACGKSNCKKCPHGPYVYSYQRDGDCFPATYVDSSKFSRLPHAIREKFRVIREEARAERARVLSGETVT